MRAVLWVMVILLVVALPAGAATEVPQSSTSAPAKYPNTTVNDQMRSMAATSTLQRLSFGQASVLVGGSVLGAFFVGRVLARLLSIDRLPMTFMGILFGATVAGQWCDKDLWPC